ncbi:MAG: polyisoprenoid-binding protein [Betaproteobacteria bacterium]|nr:polyisoprenoid-binding protein [Betaproteobacteria bacterium]
MSEKLAIALIAAALPLSVSAAPESYTIDPYHSFVHFEVDHIGGLTRMRGRFDKTAGKFTLDQAAKTGSLDVTVQTTSVTTGDNDKGSRPRSRDEHLRTPDFFNVAEFPTMTFKSTNVVFKSDNPGSIEGNLTLLGVTKPVTLNIERWKCMPHPQSKKDMCGGNATGVVKRSDFGMKFGIPSVGDELALFIGVEGYKE